MVTVHELGARRFLDRLLSDQTLAVSFVDFRNGIRGGRFREEYLDAIGQTGRPGGQLAVEQEAAAMWVVMQQFSGRLGVVTVEVGETPLPDKRREENAARLADVAEPFTADLDLAQNCGDSDGTLSWREPVRVEKCVEASYLPPCTADAPSRIMRPVALPPGSLPLEVGSSLPSRTAMHIAQGRGVARWPYGSEWITLFVTLDNTIRERLSDVMMGTSYLSD